MVQLNRPKSVPIYLLPDIAFVMIVNGIASIAAHAAPIKAYDIKSVYWFEINILEMKPIAPTSSDMIYAPFIVKRFSRIGISVAQIIEPTA